MKAAGGIRTSKNAIQYLVQVHETLGPDWLTPDLYRIGASSLVNDILMQLRKERTGRYQRKDSRRSRITDVAKRRGPSPVPAD